MIITIPVSIGEAIDKLTILDIKLYKIIDERHDDVKKEFDLLKKELVSFINQYQYYYQILKNVNLVIWELQDELRDNKDLEGDEYFKICKKIIDENDRRFRVKNKINNLSKSELKEQKGYKLKEAFVMTHLGLGDNITAIGMIRYISTNFDRVHVVCQSRNLKNLEEFYSDDPSIILYPVGHFNEICPQTSGRKKFSEITKNMTTFVCGQHIGNKNITHLPFCFYQDVNINTQYFWDYFHISKGQKSLELYNKIPKIQEYVFIHNISSQGEVFSTDLVEKKIKINKNEILFINPCKNMYEENHVKYALAQEFVNHLLADYVDLIINANYVVVTDSSFMCMAINLEIKTENCYLYSRDNADYSYLYDKFKFNDNLKRQIFKNLKNL